MKASIDSAGRMVIPRPIREAAGLTPGAELRLKYRDGRVEIEPVPARTRWARRADLKVARLPGGAVLTNDLVNRTLEATRRR